VCEAPACNDEDGDGFGDPASETCPDPRWDCDDDSSDDPWICGIVPGCGYVATALCARCINPDGREVVDDGVDSNCNGNDNCFIATASFGTDMSGKIQVLREFRDDYLMTNEPGMAFVEAYYEYSPPIAEYIEKRSWLRVLVRTLLLPVVGLVSLLV